MATAAKAIERIAEATGVLHATAFRAARALREFSVSLWPQGGKGRGQEAHVDAAHLVNLVLAIAAAEPITAAVRAVATYKAMTWADVRLFDHDKRDLPRVTRESIAPVEKATFGPWLNIYGDTLGQHLDGLVLYLSKDRDASFHDMLRRAEFSLYLTLGARPEASLHVIFGMEAPACRAEMLRYRPAQDPLPFQGTPKGLSSAADIPFSVFEAMAELVADTRAHYEAEAPRIAKRALAKLLANPDDEPAGSLPGPPADTRTP